MSCRDDGRRCTPDDRCLQHHVDRDPPRLGELLRDPDQAWFWTPEWQAGEREADADLAAGRVRRFHTLDDMDAELRGSRP
ncbi:hypothetical protein [Micromonospora aurantiaca (nom. illeg.)]|uniref:hypothetical protein n=1 Tax=Micromonospora aurantiaca (nom. illeg.) TaxID=47850 RepID=UPI003F49B67A